MRFYMPVFETSLTRHKLELKLHLTGQLPHQIVRHLGFALEFLQSSKHPPIDTS